MFRNHFVSALRNLLRNRLYAGINIGGLALGLAAAMLIALFVRDELTYDQFLPDHERIFRVSSKMGVLLLDTSSPRAAPLLQSMFPQVEAIGRLAQDQAVFKRGEVRVGEVFFWADAEFFEVVRLPAIAGDPRTALRTPDAVVITRAIARKYFGRDAPLGETILLGDHPMKVGAVLEDLPSNTHFRAEIFAAGHAAFSMLTRVMQRAPYDHGFEALTYMRLASPGAATAIRAALPDFLARLGLPAEQFQARLQNIADIHLATAGVNAMKPAGDRATVYAVCAIGLLVLLAASINFVNLMTARATRRALEVGIRKAAGASRHDLIAQFTGESILYAAIGAVLAVAIVELCLPEFNGFLGRTIEFDYWSDPLLVALLLALVLVVGVVAGSYPAFVLSSFHPTVVLRGARGGAGLTHFVRQALVVVQFAILIGLIAATGIVYRQTLFAVRETVRVATDEVLIIKTPCRNRFENEVRALPGVREVTCANRLPLGLEKMGMSYGDGGSGSSPQLYYATVDLNFFQFYKLAARAGRLFSAQHPGDLVPTDPRNKEGRDAVIINETALRSLGYDSPQHAIGQSPSIVANTRPVEIVGVVEDFRIGSVREPVAPLGFYVNPSEFRTLHVRLRAAQIPETLDAIDALWKKFGEPRAIVRTFLSQGLEELHGDLERQSRLAGMFAAVALLIGCLGLFGLSAFNAERRTKEIGVRKALGAETRHVMRLLVWQFIKPVLWANLLAWPISAWLMHRWLEQFTYRIDLEAWYFAAASALALAIAVLTVAGHCYVAARARPVSALRYE